MQCTIERGIKDREHPFAQVSRALINDNTISTDLRFLIIYCISKPDNWKYNVTDLARSLNKSEATIYRILKEGISKGYVHRAQQRDALNKFLAVSYKIFEEKQPIQKVFPVCKNRDAAFRDAENDTLSNNDSLVTKNARDKKERLNVPKNPETKEYKRKNRHIPEFLSRHHKYLSQEDQQKLANQFSESVLYEAVEDAKSFSKEVQSIDNLPAWITARCKKILNNKEKTHEQF